MGPAKVDNKKAFTTFRLVPSINQKNYYTSYLKRESQYLASKTRTRTPTEAKGDNVLVLHLGSRNLRIGRASDSYPVVIPCVAARKPLVGEHPQQPLPPLEGLEESLEEVNQDFKERMRFYRTKIVGNAAETCRTFNSRQAGEPLPADDEPDKIPDSDLRGSWYGDNALKMASLDSDLALYWPIRRGKFNTTPYDSPEELLGDIEGIILHAIVKLRIPIKELEKYDAVLLIPDLYSKTVVEKLLRLLLTTLGLANVSVIQESVAATFGAGISASCIVDIGAQTTKVSCVEEGYCIPDSRVRLDYGGDDISIVFARLLEKIDFPCSAEINLARSWADFSLLNRLKEKYATTNEADIAVQLYSFTRNSRKYSFKVYNEVMLPFLGLFYPDVFRLMREPRAKFLERAHDPYDGRLSDPLSDADINLRAGTLAVFGQYYQTAQILPTDSPAAPATELRGTDSISVSREGTPVAESKSEKPSETKEKPSSRTRAQLDVYETLDLDEPVSTPLDHAIIESIQLAVQNSTAMAASSPRAFYENILIVGGGAKVSGFHQLLLDRLGMWLQNHIKEDHGDVTIMPVPRELDPQIIAWKGASVYSKLKVCDEMWISKYEWEMLGSRALSSRALFFY